MIGRTLGHYRIVAKIGSGGMGEVYQAHDERLERDVALKVLPTSTLADESARKRFRKEALALSKLNHPNIATVHDFDTQAGVDFLVMELVSGETLNEKLKTGALKEREILLLGTQLAEGLAAAHAQGIVHRDLKPGNLRITPEGRIKILDFGLAKLLQRTVEPDVTRSLNETNGVAGTLPYMSPEQLQGEPADARTDIYAAGTVLYEMATGRRPFEEELSTALVNDIIHSTPPPPGRLNPALSPKLEDIILKCLEKEPDNRYQSARELVVDLRNAGARSKAAAAQPITRSKTPWHRLGLGAGIAVVALAGILILLNSGRWRERLFGRSAHSRIESLAVLPLENLSRDPEQDYFADGMTEELITDLGKVGALRVTSRTSVMQYKGTLKAVPEIGKELGVDALVEGSVLQSGGRVRITAQLIDARTDRHVWAESYERDMQNVLPLQDEVARAIAQQIQIKLTPQEQVRLASAHSVNPEAHEAYLKGRYYWNKRTEEALKKSIEYFQQAIDKDSNYGLAYAGLADSYSTLQGFGLLSPKEAMPRAEEAAKRALEIDETLAEARVSLAVVRFWYSWDAPAAESDFKRAIELNPSLANAHSRYGEFLIFRGRFPEATVEIRQAQALDPFSLIINSMVGYTTYYSRQYDQAIAELLKAVEMDTNFFLAHRYLARAYTGTGKYNEAISEFGKAVTLSDENPRVVAELGYAYAVSKDKSRAQKVLNDLQKLSKRKYVPPYSIALIYAGLGERDQAFRWLEKSYAERSGRMVELRADPMLDNLRSDPRFQDLLRRVGLAP
jgi:serine/threonine protein kinase/tetratricopeptide (TPR) repeat protein